MPPKAKRQAETGTEDGAPKEKKVKEAAKKNGTKPKKEEIPDVNNIDFTSTATNADGKLWNKKFSSWNVNGIRAWAEKNGHSYITAEKPDIFCVQETKCDKAKIPKDVELEGYHTYWLSGDKEGYSGTGLYSKEKPLSVSYGLGIEKHDTEGRVITAEYEDYYFVTAYVPNAGRGLPRLPYRTQEWDPDFRAYLKGLDAKKPVIACGDLNVAHLTIDCKNAKNNAKQAGFTKEERAGFTALLEEGFIDTFRQLYPDLEGAYSYWTYMANARAKNVGWRLDYFVISERLKDKLCDSVIRKDVFGSDHCPVALMMHL